ncbi:hypothetical protein Bbelb_122700 [Branchiostoma belcheri]|nr:hypothetical protein Bbelb_122700 [Branchiostoma belcheri]
MASNMPDDFDEEFLTCVICMLNYRDPKILPCLHSFCRECLQEWATKQQPLECPTCREPVRLPGQGVDGLRTNFYVNNLLDFAAAKKGAEPGVPCQVCEGNVEGSKSWCVDCAILMCETCTLHHRKFPYSKDHEVVAEETLKTEKDAGNFHRKRHCPKHKNQELVFYCESCNALVCTACTVVDHRPGKHHNPVEIATVAQRRKAELQGLLQDIDPRLKEIQDAKREEDILSQIDEQCRADGKALQAKKEAIEFELAGLTSAQTFCQQAVEHGSDVHVLEVGNQVQTRVETLLTKQLDLESDWSEFQFVENTTVDDRKAVKVNMKNPSGRNVPIQVQMKSRGLWEISCTPKVTGNHRLEVKVNSQHVAGSPFDVDVKGNPVLTIRQKGKEVGELIGPAGVAVDKDGNIAVVEQVNKRVQVFNANTGESLRSFPVEGEKPFGIDVDSEGRFLVTSWGENFGLRRFSKEGELLNTLKPDCMHSPHGVTVLKDGRMVVADPNQHSCLLLQPDGSLIREIGKGQLQKPVYVSVDESRDVMFVTDSPAHKVVAFDLDGNLKFDFGRQGDNDGEFKAPEGVTCDQAGNIIVGNEGTVVCRCSRLTGLSNRNWEQSKGSMPAESL